MPEMSEEQRKELTEKLKNMSPEELREFQKKQCIFCQIVEGKVDSRKVYEDDTTIAVLDINPANTGHVLLMPKEHYSIMPQMPNEVIAKLGEAAKKLSQAALRAFKAHGTSIFIANGIVAGQKAQHFMLHIIPRTNNDGVGLSVPQNEIKEEELAPINQNIQNKINKLFGIKKEVIVDKKVQKESKAKEKDITKENIKETVKKETKKETVKEKKEIKRPEKSENGGNVSLDDIANLFR